MSKRVFLGGTCNGSTWRNQIIEYLSNVNMTYFNPVVDEWNADAQANELREREECDFCLYGITPKMTGVYSIAEVIDDSNKRPEKTVLVIMKDDGKNRFTEQQWKSLEATAKMVERNGGKAFHSLKQSVVYMNSL